MTAVDSDPPNTRIINCLVVNMEKSITKHSIGPLQTMSEGMLDDVLVLSMERWLRKDRSESSWLRHMHKRLGG